ncbi:dihydrodipicolinate synthase family protein [Granulicella paludicola]|uniref:dihydrodipicolinate synthase family protein n=1 Tax=Granulicella paludicola TaxID=474951 RepID=UPI0021E0D179|nr:dihydrodipicolinate synthase family protein [Granulicella paludicola]
MKWFSRKKEQYAVRIACDPDGVSVFGASGEIHRIVWAEIERVLAYKKDCFGYDQIQVTLIGSSKTVSLTEEEAGFTEFVTDLPQYLPPVPREWYVALVASPAFDATIHTLYQRS